MERILIFVGVGFIGQMVDGALGMAYGVTCTTALLWFGIAPAVASASVHAAEVFTTAASGYAHWRLGNVDKRLVLRLAVPGMIGGALGAYVLTSVPGERLLPFVSVYLLVLGVVIIWRGLVARPSRQDMGSARIAGLGVAGGFLDAAGGGGWGPIVTSTLLGSGAAPRTTIGSVNVAEFFVAATITATFVATIGLELWPIIAGMIAGGIIAAPLAALVASRVPARPLLLLVGILVILISFRNLLKSLA